MFQIRLVKNVIRFQSELITRSLSTKLGVRRLVWVGLEKTGLNVDTDHILEVSCVITDEYLNYVAQNPNLTVHQPEPILSSLNKEIRQKHDQSGLIKECRASTLKLTNVEQILIEFLSKYVNKDMCPLVGDLAYIDKLFLKKYLPEVDCYLNRIVDVSTIKLLCSTWNPALQREAPTNKLQCRSLESIKQNIEELQFYKNMFIKLPNKENKNRVLFL